METSSGSFPLILPKVLQSDPRDPCLLDSDIFLSIVSDLLLVCQKFTAPFAWERFLARPASMPVALA